MAHGHKHKNSGLNLLELFTAIGAIIIFWLGLKLGMRWAASFFGDSRGEFWHGIVTIAAGLVAGFVPAGIFAGCLLFIDSCLQKRKKNQ